MFVYFPGSEIRDTEGNIRLCRDFSTGKGESNVGKNIIDNNSDRRDPGAC